MNQMKRIAAIHDLSSFGRCSLAVIIPMLSVMKHQVCPLPTTILSSHTGGLFDPVIHDLPGYVDDALAHYKKLGIDYHCIYSGYLGDVSHVDDCLAFMEAYPLACKVVDPVMGDHGLPYRHITKERIDRMRDLVRVADMITPNITEVYLLLEETYTNQALTLEAYKKLLVRLGELGPNQVVITGALQVDGSYRNLGYDKIENTFYGIPCYYSNASYPGTGDMFASLLIGNVMQQKSLPESIEEATRFLELVIRESVKKGEDTRYGVIFEPYLGWLLEPKVTYEYRLF